MVALKQASLTSHFSARKFGGTGVIVTADLNRRRKSTILLLCQFGGLCIGRLWSCRMPTLQEPWSHFVMYLSLGLCGMPGLIVIVYCCVKVQVDVA